jgi:biopolymer transport protein TolQ
MTRWPAPAYQLNHGALGLRRTADSCHPVLRVYNFGVRVHNWFAKQAEVFAVAGAAAAGEMHNCMLLAFVIGGEIASLVLQSGLVAKAVLLILLFFSILSWAIILSKWSLMRRARVQSGRFVRAFRKSARLQDMAAVAEQFKPSPLVGVFESAYEELRRQGGVPHNVTAIQRAAQIGISESLTRMERRLSWLAITGATTPFIGLFGTVWGIIDAFHGLGTAGAATLRAVAPGISEALITTAAGLVAAVPAVIAYNLLGSAVREFGARMEDFTLELLNVVERTPQPARAMAETSEYRS